MNLTIRIPRAFHSRLVHDLERPHDFAFERVGWIFARQASADNNNALLFPVAYEPVADENYVEDDDVGARFNAAAIRAALQRSRSSSLSCLQVHLHNHHGETDFSGVDCKTIDELAPSFRNLVRTVAHGGVVLSRDSATGRIWVPGATRSLRPRIVIVGFPMHAAREGHVARAL